MSKTAIYPGTFDPITNGHLSIIRRALQVFENIIIAILHNPQKTPLFSIDERIYMIKHALKGEKNVEIDTFEGLLVDYAVKKKTNVILRGLRALSDFEYEFQLALMNRKLNRDVQSIFLTTDYKWFYTSSTIIKEAASLGGDVSGLVPYIVNRKLKEKFRQSKKT
ncbi:MAG TPA: pantetheine-phosphate adenylyltransferase [Desulfobacteraceae bacterium]|nr:pantetheine-phosphate adenylyltransferase [Desulfobacteraceae bacterium]